MGSGTAKEDRQGRVKTDGHSRLPSDFCTPVLHARKQCIYTRQQKTEDPCFKSSVSLKGLLNSTSNSNRKCCHDSWNLVRRTHTHFRKPWEAEAGRTLSLRTARAGYKERSSQTKKRFAFILCVVGALPSCVCTMCLPGPKVRGECQISWNCSFCIVASELVLELKPGSSAIFQPQELAFKVVIHCIKFIICWGCSSDEIH